MTPKQVIPPVLNERRYSELPGRPQQENHDHIADQSLQGDEGYLYQDCNSEAEADKEAASIRVQKIVP